MKSFSLFTLFFCAIAIFAGFQTSKAGVQSANCCCGEKCVCEQCECVTGPAGECLCEDQGCCCSEPQAAAVSQQAQVCDCELDCLCAECVCDDCTCEACGNVGLQVSAINRSVATEDCSSGCCQK